MRKNEQSERLRRLARLAVLLSLLGALTPAAEGKLVLETRFVDRSGGSGDVQVGDVFHFDVFAVVTGRNAVLTDEALQSIHGRFLSKDVNGGFLRGNLDATPLAPYNDVPSTGGTAQDLDGDGDLDLGGTDPRNPDGWFVARVSPIKGIPFATGEPQEFKFARLNFTVTQVLAGGSATDTVIQFEQRQFETAGLWFVDGQLRDWTVDPGTSGGGSLGAASVGDPDGFFFPAASLKAAVPEPGCAIGCAVAALGVLVRRRRR